MEEEETAQVEEEETVQVGGRYDFFIRRSLNVNYYLQDNQQELGRRSAPPLPYPISTGINVSRNGLRCYI